MAMVRWSQAPTELESDLLPKADIYDWHRGTLDQFGALKLSSRRLLVLIDKLDDESAYRTALRGGYWSEKQLIQAEIYNELALLRSAYFTVNGPEGSGYEPFQFVDPIVRIEKAIEQHAEDEEAEQAEEQYYRDMGWS
jgi:hypothetical protein